jgi:hypothetical protein
MVVADKVPEAAREAELRDDFKVDLGKNDDEGCKQQRGNKKALRVLKNYTGSSRRLPVLPVTLLDLRELAARTPLCRRLRPGADQCDPSSCSRCIICRCSCSA